MNLNYKNHVIYHYKAFSRNVFHIKGKIANLDIFRLRELSQATLYSI